MTIPSSKFYDTMSVMEEEKPKQSGNSFWELVRFAIIAIAIVLPIRIFIAQPFVVSGSSMVPTFQDGQYLIVDEISYRLGTPERGDVVIFRYPKDPSKFFIKRIIGLPNETVDVDGNEITITSDVHPDGMKLPQPYLRTVSNTHDHMVLGSDEYFVMGDNRPGSSDSRVWGPVERKFIIGKAFLRLLPIGEIKLMPGAYEYED